MLNDEKVRDTKKKGSRSKESISTYNNENNRRKQPNVEKKRTHQNF